MLLDIATGDIVFAKSAERDEFYAKYGGASVIPAKLAEADKAYLRLANKEIEIGSNGNKTLVVVVGAYESVPLHYEVRQPSKDAEPFSFQRLEQAKAMLNGTLIAPQKPSKASASSGNALIDEAMRLIAENMDAPLCISPKRLAKLLAQDGEAELMGHARRHCAWWNAHRAKKAGL